MNPNFPLFPHFSTPQSPEIWNPHPQTLQAPTNPYYPGQLKHFLWNWDVRSPFLLGFYLMDHVFSFFFFFGASIFWAGLSIYIYIILHISGWWFGTFSIFPYIENNHPNWLLYFSEGWPNHQPDIHWIFSFLLHQPLNHTAWSYPIAHGNSNWTRGGFAWAHLLNRM